MYNKSCRYVFNINNQIITFRGLEGGKNMITKTLLGNGMINRSGILRCFSW